MTNGCSNQCATSPSADPPILGAVQETLLIPLYMRARETLRDDAIIRDPRAVEIVRGLDYDFRRFDTAWRVQLDVAIRTEILDQLVSDFVGRHPEALVVNLGAGLDGRFWRLDNGLVRWVDIDLPDAIELRGRYYSQSSRNRFLARSALDPRWFDEIGYAPGQPTLLVAEGLFCYFEEPQLRTLLADVAQRLPGAELVFQSISPRYVGRQDRVPAINRTRAEFRWGVHSGRELVQWDPRLEFRGEWAFIDRYPRRWRWLRYLRWFPAVDTHLREVMKITHLRIRPADAEVTAR